LNPYFHAFLGACEGNTTCNWVVSVYVATFRNVSKKTEGNGFYVEVKDVADFELI
jgi:hypothetical protein